MSMEEVVREHLRKSNMQSLSLSTYSHRQDHNVPFNLCIAAADFGEVEEKDPTRNDCCTMGDNMWLFLCKWLD